MAITEDQKRTSARIDLGGDALQALQDIAASGLPTHGSDTTGANTYAAVVTAPDRECHYLHVAVADNGAIISLDGGVTDHFAIPANTERLFPGLVIPAGAGIQGKNLVTSSNYTNLHISVW